MSQHLVTSILFDRTLALEWEDSSLPENLGRLRFEKLLLDVYKKERVNTPGKWLVILGLSEAVVPFSPPLEFWRSFARNWILQVRTLPDCEEKREALSLDLTDREAQAFLEPCRPWWGSIMQTSLSFAHLELVIEHSV